MEPPAKRMRILQSIGIDEVDESNPDYIKGKQKNGEWLKNKFEAIYAKFGAMPDMMSDEVDMRGEGAIVVDRGHMRKLDKEYRNRIGRRGTVMPDESQLIDDMFANDEEMDMDDEDEEDEDERDELAPSQSPEPMLRKSTTDQHVSPIARSNGQTDIPVPNTPISTTLQATLAASVNPAADLLQLVQFPQTPAGQQARKAFEAHTAQAVQQAVASIFSSLLSTVPTLQSPQLGNVQPPETPAAPAVETREVAPATAPSLYRPPQTVVPDPPVISQSSPVPVQPERRKRRSFAVGVHIKPRRHDSTRADVPLIVDNATTQATEEDDNETSANDDLSNVKTSETSIELSSKPRSRAANHPFTAEDDLYIIESRVIHKRTWPEILETRPQWKNWTTKTFGNRWCNKLRKQAAEMERSGELDALRARVNVEEAIKDSPTTYEQLEAQPHSSPVARHLPTPSSLGHTDDPQPSDLGIPEDLIASGGHFDDDEKDLLSLYEDDPQADPLDSDDTSTDPSSAREIPETPLNLTQETSSQAILQGIVTREATADVAPTSQTTHNHVPPKKNQKLTTSKIVSTPLSKKPTAKQIHTCPLCRQTFPTPALLARHTTHPHPREVHITASSPLPLPRTPAEQDIDVVIKREPSTSAPPPFSSSFENEHHDGNGSAPHTALPSSSSTATVTGTPTTKGKLSRAEYNAVKRAWARGAKKAGGTTPAKRKRQSFGAGEAASRKQRAWEDGGDGNGSEDELGL